MSADPRAALSHLVAALERHLEASAARHGEDDPTVLAAYDDLADAFEAYDSALYDAYGEMTPLDVYAGPEDDDEDDDLDDEDDDLDDEDDDLDDEDDLVEEAGTDDRAEAIDVHGDEDGDDEHLYAGLGDDVDDIELEPRH